MKPAECVNAVRDPDDRKAKWIHCGWQGKVKSLTEPCPRCCRAGVLAPVVQVPKPGGKR